MNKDQVYELHEDIERYLSLEEDDTHVEFWTVSLSSLASLTRSLCSLQNMMVICKDYLDRLRQNERLGVEAAAAVEEDITRLLKGKTYDQLASLQRQVQAKLTSGEPIDTDYWESLVKKLLVWKSKVCLHKWLPNRRTHINIGKTQVAS